MDTKTEGTAFEKYLTPIAVVVGALIIAGAFAFGHGNSGNTNQGQQQAQKVDVKDIKTDGDPVIGSPNAPVTMVIWFDYQCPFCKQLELNVTSLVYEQYVKTGKVKIVFKDFQFLGSDSTTGAEFARAMWELYPDKFYEWQHTMFEAQDDEGDRGFGDLDSIKTMTAKIQGVDVEKVVSLMNQKKSEYDTAIGANRDEGQKFGINGTPAVVIGTTLLSGAQPLSAVTSLLDAELKK